MLLNSTHLDQILNTLEPFYIFPLIGFGLIGNTITIILLVFSKLKYQKTSLVLSLVAFSDNFFLATLLIVNLPYFNVNLFDKFNLVCKFTVYFTYVFSFLSIWLIVVFSLERLIAVVFPLKRAIFCNHKFHKLSLLMLICFAVVLFSFSLFTSGTEKQTNEQYACITYNKWFNFVRVFTCIDTFITTVFPLLIITFSNVSIAYKLTKIASLNQEKSTSHFSPDEEDSLTINDQLTCSTKIPSKKSASHTFSSIIRRSLSVRDRSIKSPSNTARNIRNNKKKFSVVDMIARKSDQQKRRKRYSKSTKILLIVSTLSLILNSPIALTKTFYFIQSHLKTNKLKELNHQNGLNLINFLEDNLFVANKSIKSVEYMLANATLKNEIPSSDLSSYYHDPDSLQPLIERIACYIYYLSFSINFVIYNLGNLEFRRTFWQYFQRLNK